MKRIFVSHPFKDDPKGNREKVDKICKNLLSQGYLPLSPLHLFGFMEDDTHREEVMHVCYDLIDISDEVWVYGTSEGCKAEEFYAFDQGKVVSIMY